MKLKICVTADDIRVGKRECCELCPVALAVKRAFLAKRPGVRPGAVTVVVVTDWCNVWVAHLSGMQFAMPRNAAAFVYAFDSGQHVKPFTFEIETDEF